MNRNEEIARDLRALANKATANGVAGIGTELSVEDTRLLHKAADKIAPLPMFSSVDAAFAREFGDPLAGIGKPQAVAEVR